MLVRCTVSGLLEANISAGFLLSLQYYVPCGCGDFPFLFKDLFFVLHKTITIDKENKPERIVLEIKL